ncbi:hypothetical protein SO802_026354 [Lithocarpus litseifolius]|uniref:Uncharacterized protein n=1 Tax=Lithocarpus litseifolius TaxID=425828 RepID=A0AAW2C306_9ROSI
MMVLRPSVSAYLSCRWPSSDYVGSHYGYAYVEYCGVGSVGVALPKLEGQINSNFDEISLCCSRRRELRVDWCWCLKFLSICSDVETHLVMKPGSLQVPSLGYQNPEAVMNEKFPEPQG